MKEVPEISATRGITSAEGLHLLHQMLLIRRFEDKSAELYTRMKIRGFLHLYNGEEAIAVGVMDALTKEDNVLCSYREHGQAIARGVGPDAIMAEMYGRLEGCSRGRGGSMHLFDAEKKFYGGSAIVAGHLPMALGMALASKKERKNNVTCCFFGEGAMAEGVSHETMNLASLWSVPLLMVCENNRYAMGTALRYSLAEQDVEKRGIAYNITSKAIDGMDVLVVRNAAREAIETIRKTGKPYFLVCNTYRFRAHSMFDAELYRDKSEVEEWKKRDPIPKLQNYLISEKLITENDVKEIEKRVDAEVQRAVDFAESGTWEAVEQLTKFVYT